jgi:hypothetical protein
MKILIRFNLVWPNLNSIAALDKFEKLEEAEEMAKKFHKPTMKQRKARQLLGNLL